jgi:hypothetical protein
MNPLHPNDPSRQAAQAFSERLASLAAESPSSRPEASPTQLDATSAPLATRLTSLIARRRQRAQRREEAADKLRAQEFMMGL